MDQLLLHNFLILIKQLFDKLDTLIKRFNRRLGEDFICRENILGDTTYQLALAGDDLILKVIGKDLVAAGVQIVIY